MVVEIVPLHSSLGNKSKTPSQKKNAEVMKLCVKDTEGTRQLNAVSDSEINPFTFGNAGKI